MRRETKEADLESNVRTQHSQLQQELMEKRLELKVVQEALDRERQEHEQHKAFTRDELRQNATQIEQIRDEYKTEIERLGELLATVTQTNEALKNKADQLEARLYQSEDIICDYKKMIEGLNVSKERQMQELMAVEAQNAQLLKQLEVVPA